MSIVVPKTKGVGFFNVQAFVLERFGQSGWEDVLDRLGPEDHQEVDGLLPMSWYPLAVHARLINAVDVVHGYGDLSLVVQLGRFEAERNLTTIHRFFLRFANPAVIFELTSDYWRRFHDTGDWTVVRDGEEVHGTLENWGTTDPAMCREIVGYVGRALELAGAKNLLMEHPKCRSRGDDICYFQGRWGDKRNAKAELE